MSTPQTMAFARHHRDYMVTVHSNRAPSDAEWAAYLSEAGAWLPELRGSLIVSEGGGPTSSQRRSLKKLFEQHTGHSAFFALISPSLLARGIVLAINLFNPYIRAFRPEDLDQAMKFLRVPDAERPALLAVAQRLREQLGDA